MPFALVPINDQLLHACESGAVVTPNQRLARELKASFDIRMHARDAETWRTPRIASKPTKGPCR